MADVLTLTVRSVTRGTPLTRVLRLDLGGSPFAFCAGQSVLLGRHGLTVKRPYSLVSSPDEAKRHRRLEFLLRVDLAGHAGLHLPALERGVRVDLEGPFGSFTLPDRVAPSYLFVAGGTGIAPLRSMIRQLIASGVRVPIAVLYSAREAVEFAYRDELERLARRDLLRLHLTVTGQPGETWTGGRGRVGAPLLEQLLPGRDGLSFVCGPPSFVEDIRPLLTQLGVTPTSIRYDKD